MKPRLLDWLAWLAARLGWPGLGGLALMLAAGLADWGVTEPLRAESAVLAAKVARLETQRTAQAPERPAPALAERLPGASHTPEAVAALFAAAGKAGLRLDKGDYKLVGTGGDDLMRYQIGLPLLGGYPALRGFLAGALNGNPDLALDGLSLSREAVEATELAAHVRFTLFLSGKGGR